MDVSGELHTATTLLPGKKPRLPNAEETGGAPQPVLMLSKSKNSLALLEMNHCSNHPGSSLVITPNRCSCMIQSAAEKPDSFQNGITQWCSTSLSNSYYHWRTQYMPFYVLKSTSLRCLLLFLNHYSNLPQIFHQPTSHLLWDCCNFFLYSLL
jgi:hypothetical protein